MGGDLRRDAEAIFDASIEAVLPRKLVERSLKRSGNELTVLGSGVTVKLKKNVYIYAFGKAVLGMVTAVDGLCHDHIVHGVASVPEGMVQTLRNKLPHLVPPDTCLVEIIQGAENNMPDASAHRAARRIMEGAQRTAQDDIVIILVSGGGSALLPLPADGLTLQDVRDTTMACARQGASINELNTIRKHLSAVQGGQLAAAVYPASAITLVLSDVVGDPLDVIASGPTVPDPTSFHDCKCILKRLGLTAATLPARVVQHIAAGVAGRVPDTPTGEHVAFQTRPPRVHTTQLVGTNAIALHAARCEAEARGYTVIPWGSAVEMEARAFAKLFAAKLHTLRSSQEQHRICLLGGGETTCVVSGTGRGGRNQEIALQAALCLPPSSRDSMLILSGGTDGQDGPTDAAGGIGHGGLADLCASHGLCATEYLKVAVPPLCAAITLPILPCLLQSSHGTRYSLLSPALPQTQNNDSYALLDKVGLHLRTGLTGTNVMDVFIGLSVP
eukprot:m.42386 g.42386  ORF g.42386 m.42386 type:complete len:500 (+) comp15027_c0_seq1:205-1704(+)